MLFRAFHVMRNNISKDLVQIAFGSIYRQWQASLDTADIKEVIDDAGQRLALAVSFGEEFLFLLFIENTEIFTVK